MLLFHDGLPNLSLERFTFNSTVAYWLEGPSREREIVGLIPGHRSKSLKLVVVAFPLGAQDYGNSTMIDPAVSG